MKEIIVFRNDYSYRITSETQDVEQESVTSELSVLSTSTISGVETTGWTEIEDQPPKKQPKISELFFTARVTKKREELITESITEMVALDLLPISFVEGKGFKRFLRRALPDYKCPSRNTFKTRLFLLHDVEKKKLENKIKNFSNVALTTDMWTARNNDDYITVTLHGINEGWEHLNYTLVAEYVVERHTARNIKKNWNQSL